MAVLADGAETDDELDLGDGGPLDHPHFAMIAEGA
jgi:hypothetical protein